METEELQTKKEKIQEQGLTAISNYFDLDIRQLSNLDKTAVQLLQQKAKLGMHFEREMNISKRALDSNTLRIIKMIATDKREVRKLIQNSLPTYLK